MEDKVTVDIKKLIQVSKDDRLLPRCCIYRMSPLLRHLNEEAYTPKLTSIGPFHYDDKRLQDKEEYKQMLFKAFTLRAMSSLDDLIRFVKLSEPKVRASYSENIKLSEEELVKLTLVDAGFIIELFIRYHASDGRCDNDSKLSQPWFAHVIRTDLLLLENQLPFFVIEGLFDIAFPLGLRDLPSFHELSCKFFSNFNIQKLEPHSTVGIEHFTDLLRKFHLPATQPQRKALTPELLYSANELKEAGVELKVTRSTCLLDLKFSGHTLEIPRFSVQDRTERLFRNMIALEQCHYPYNSYITDYVAMLDCLINTEKDVDVLVHNKILRPCIGDTTDVAKMVNGLCKHVHIVNVNSDYSDICKSLNAYYENWWHKTKATLRRDYCSTPWQFVASIAGIVLLILSVVQTIFSILQVAK